VSSNGIQSTPLNLATYWKCNPTTTDVRLDYKYNPESMVVPSALSNIQVVVPVDGGSGSLRAKFDLSEGPSNPSTLAVQFVSDGSTLSGVDIELVGTGYRLSLVKKRFCTEMLFV
ncbi:hypothetical protein AB205_0093180, partial [Aquarana catesbeiana]